MFNQRCNLWFEVHLYNIIFLFFEYLIIFKHEKESLKFPTKQKKLKVQSWWLLTFCLSMIWWYKQNKKIYLLHYVKIYFISLNPYLATLKAKQTSWWNTCLCHLEQFFIFWIVDWYAFLRISSTHFIIIILEIVW